MKVQKGEVPGVHMITQTSPSVKTSAATTASLGQLERMLNGKGLEVLGTDLLIHNPRGVSTLLFMTVHRMAGNRADRALRWLLARLDRLGARVDGLFCRRPCAQARHINTGRRQDSRMCQQLKYVPKRIPQGLLREVFDNRPDNRSDQRGQAA
jgi:hypothetical protein